MKEKVVILGAGIAGLSVGYFLSRSGRYEVVVLEQSQTVGGLCASFPYKNFTLDFGPHKIYSVLPGILDDLVALMGDRALRVEKKNKIFINGHYLEYPLKLTNLLNVLGPKHFLKILTTFAFQKIHNLVRKKNAQSYEDFMIQTFGQATYQLIFEPLAEKVWGAPQSLHADMARIRVSSLNTFHLILRLLKLLPESQETSAKYFYYPKKGFGDFAEKLKEEIQATGGKILTNAFIKEFHHKDNQITGITVEIGKGSAQFSCDTLISSIALPQLLNYVLPEKQDADVLSARHLLLVYLFVNKPKVIDEQWVFFPERKFIFSRISEQKNMSEDIAPDDKTIVCCDFTCEADSEIWSTNDDLLITRCAQQLAEAKIMNLADIQKDACFVIRKKNFYPRYDLQYLEKMAHVTSKLKKFTNLLTTGRLGMFNYNNSDHCFDMGKFIAQGLSDKKTCPQIWAELEERVREYKIVD